MNAKKYMDLVDKRLKTRDNVSLYLDVELLRQFREACADSKPNRIIEQFMREFIESAKGDRKKS